MAFVSVSCDSLHPKLTLADPTTANFKFTLSDLEETWYVPLPLYNCKSKADKRELMEFSIKYNPKKETLPLTYYYDSSNYEL